MFPDSRAEVSLRNNYLSRNIDLVKFVSKKMLTANNFKLASGSPLIDKAEEDNPVNFDFSGSPRPIGKKSDIGAFEYTTESSKVIR